MQGFRGQLTLDLRLELAAVVSASGLDGHGLGPVLRLDALWAGDHYMSNFALRQIPGPISGRL